MKQVFTLSREQLKEMFKKEIERLTSLGKKKEIKKIELMLQMVDNANEIATFKVEGVKGNTNERTMINCGSLIECLVKHYQKNYIELWKEFNDSKDDTKNGFISYEIKASLPNARNTALRDEKTVLLVNATGVYLIKKSVSLEVEVDSQGRYYENMDYSQFEGVRLVKSLSRKLGFEV